MRNKSYLKKSRSILTGLTIMALCGFFIPQSVQAAVSAGATIFNQASVTYDFGAATGVNQTSTAAIVTVDVVGTQPKVTVAPTAQTTVESGVVTYTYTITSLGNGPDTYTATGSSTTDSAGMATTSGEAFGAAVTLWGGIIVPCAGVVQNADTVCIPAGGETGLTGKNVELNNELYSVGIVTAGTAQTAVAAEVTTRIQLVDDVTTHGVSANTAAAGDLVGEYADIVMTQTAGTLVAPAVPGTHTTNVTFTASATDALSAAVTYTTSAGDSNEIVTTVAAPQVVFTKTAAPLTAKPGQTITYTLVVTNNDTIPVDNVVVTDTAPAYTTYTVGTTTLNAAPAVTEITAGVAVGTLAASGGTATITFEVVVNP